MHRDALAETIHCIPKKLELNEGLKRLRAYIGEFLGLPGKEFALRYQLIGHASWIKKKANGLEFRLFHIVDPHITKMICGYRDIRFSGQFLLFL